MKEKSEPIPFQGFDPRGEVRVYKHGMLPHWRQDGCTYFVTFRLNDSLPQTVLDQLKEERNFWLKKHGINSEAENWKEQFTKLSEEKRREFERLATTKLNQQLDQGYGSCVLRKSSNAEIVANGLDHFNGLRVRSGDYVVMPNHVHALLTPVQPFELADLLKSIKGFTALKINKQEGSSGNFWQRESYDHIVRTPEQLYAFQKYIRANPQKAKLRDGDYLLKEADYFLP